jgi:hypothetical protein
MKPTTRPRAEISYIAVVQGRASLIPLFCFLIVETSLLFLPSEEVMLKRMRYKLLPEDFKFEFERPY